MGPAPTGGTDPVAPQKPTEIQADIDRRTWWLIGLSILLILGCSVTIPLLLLSLIRAGVLDGVVPTDGGAILIAGLLGLATIFSINLVYQQRRLNRMRRRTVQDQLDVEQAKSRLAELASLFQLGSTLQMELPLETMLEITVRRVASTFHAHEVDVFLLSRETKSLLPRASYGLARRAPEPEIPFGEGLVGGCARSREPILVAAGATDHRSAEFFASHPHVASALLVPLHVEQRCVGVVQICRAASAESFRAEHLELARLFAESLGAIVDRSLTAASLRQKAAADVAGGAPAGAAVHGASGAFEDVFVSLSGQELKSPLTSIVAYAEVLDQNDKRLTPALRTEFTGRLRNEAQRLMGLVDDVLDIVRLDLGRYLLDLRNGHVNEVVHGAVDALRPLAVARRVTFDLSLDEAIPSQHLDVAKIGHSIAHLLRNAVGFSPAGGNVTVRTVQGDGEVLIEIRDGGPPVALEPAAMLFELEAMTREEGARAKQGLGFGLHLAKRYVELHGGSVGTGAGPEGGSVFWIRLPSSGDLSPLVGEDPYVEDLTRSS
jgi:signal transduction histidine kinase